MIYRFSRVFVCPFRPRNQYSSSNSTTSKCSALPFNFSTSAPFFYPVHHIGMTHPQGFSYPSGAHSSVVHLDCHLSGFFRIRLLFRVYGVIYAALLTLAALTSRSIVPCLDLAFCLSAFRASFPCLYCLFPHISYSIIKSLPCTLPLTARLSPQGWAICQIFTKHSQKINLSEQSPGDVPGFSMTFAPRENSLRSKSTPQRMPAGREAESTSIPFPCRTTTVGAAPALYSSSRPV